MAILTLGNFDFIDFEIPAFIKFGGAQRVAVHNLLGGGRIVDTMGRDDAVLKWSGILSGNDAGDRARTLDTMRVEGQVLPLTWDAFGYNVVITGLLMEFCNPWWIGYRIGCTVVTEPSQSVPELGLSIVDSVLSDLKAASEVAGIANLLATASLPGALSLGSVGIRGAVNVLTIAQATVAQNISTSEAGLTDGDVRSAVSLSEDLAKMCLARGYLDRASSNLKGLLN